MQHMSEDVHDRRRTSSQRTCVEPAKLLSDQDVVSRRLVTKVTRDLPAWNCRVTLTIRWTGFGSGVRHLNDLATINLYSHDASPCSEPVSGATARDHEAYDPQANQRFSHLVSTVLHGYLRLPRAYAIRWILSVMAVSIEFTASLRRRSI